MYTNHQQHIILLNLLSLWNRLNCSEKASYGEYGVFPPASFIGDVYGYSNALSIASFIPVS